MLVPRSQECDEPRSEASQAPVGCFWRLFLALWFIPVVASKGLWGFCRGVVFGALEVFWGVVRGDVRV